jgi:hypothetical protein
MRILGLIAFLLYENLQDHGKDIRNWGSEYPRRKGGETVSWGSFTMSISNAYVVFAYLACNEV